MARRAVATICRVLIARETPDKMTLLCRVAVGPGSLSLEMQCMCRQHLNAMTVLRYTKKQDVDGLTLLQVG
jgi:hypothetical protein